MICGATWKNGFGVSPSRTARARANRPARVYAGASLRTDATGRAKNMASQTRQTPRRAAVCKRNRGGDGSGANFLLQSRRCPRAFVHLRSLSIATTGVSLQVTEWPSLPQDLCDPERRLPSGFAIDIHRRLPGSSRHPRSRRPRGVRTSARSRAVLVPVWSGLAPIPQAASPVPSDAHGCDQAYTVSATNRRIPPWQKAKRLPVLGVLFSSPLSPRHQPVSAQARPYIPPPTDASLCLSSTRGVRSIRPLHVQRHLAELS